MGRPDHLTDDVQEKILAAVRSRQHVEVAYVLAGVSKSAYYQWLGRAARARQDIAAGTRKLSDLGSLDRRCLEFVEALMRAEAQAEGFGVREIVAASSQPVTETEERVEERVVGVGENGQPVIATVRTTVTRTKPADWRAAAWMLERRHARYRARQEITGADGGPIEFTVRLAALVEVIASHQAGSAIDVEASE